jgi:mannose-6-phosphate isomerase-like protein (cupin superfamily)
MARAGEDLLNPLTGERISFRRKARETGGELLELESHWTLAGHRAPAHVHPEMQERWQILAGTAGFRIEGVERTAAAGEVVVAPAGAPHVAWNAGREPVHVLIQMRPALRWETFVERLFELAREAHAPGGRAPDPASLRQLLSEFPREIALVPPRAGDAGATSLPPG